MYRHRHHYRHRRLLAHWAALHRRATRFCAKNRMRVIFLTYRGVLKLFRQQEQMTQRARWTPHRV